MTFSVNRRVEFRDTDAAGIVHFSAFFPMMEAAEHELLRSLGIPILPTSRPKGDQKSAAEGSGGRDSGGHDSHIVTWPRVAATCDYVSAARFEDHLQIQVQVAKIGSSSVQYAFRFVRGDEPIARGSLTAVCCRLTKDDATGETHLEKMSIPDSIRSLLAKHTE